MYYFLNIFSGAKLLKAYPVSFRDAFILYSNSIPFSLLSTYRGYVTFICIPIYFIIFFRISKFRIFSVDLKSEIWQPSSGRKGRKCI